MSGRDKSGRDNAGLDSDCDRVLGSIAWAEIVPKRVVKTFYDILESRELWLILDLSG